MKRPIILCAACVALTIVILMWGFQQGESEPPPGSESYALIIESDTGSFVMQLRKGTQQAADECGARLSVCTLAEMKRLEGLNGAVIWLDDPGEALEMLDGLPAVVVGKRRADTVCVLGDDEDAGKRLVNHALSLYPKENVVLICDDEDEHAAARTRSARSLAAINGVNMTQYRDSLYLPDACEAAVATSLRGTLALIAMKREGRFKGAVLGVDTGDTRVSDLETGLVDAMALDSPYAMGYTALLKARELSGSGYAQSAVSGVLLATRDNMYLARNVKQVFPLLQ